MANFPAIYNNRETITKKCNTIEKKTFLSFYSSEEITNMVSKISINIAKTINFLVV